MGSETRKRIKIIRVRASPEEYEAIKGLAESCDISVPEFMRQMALGFTPKTTIDAQHRMNVAKLQGDLGRIGGLLKLWLSTDSIKKEAFALEIPKLIKELKVVKRLVVAEYEKLK